MTRLRFRSIGLSVPWLGAVLLAAPVTALSQDPCLSNTRVWDRMELKEITLVDRHHRSATLIARVADTPTERAAGYQFLCPDDIAGTALLFVFEQEMWTFFHMRNVKHALDILFFLGDGRLLSSHTMDQGGGRLYSPGGEFQYALEAPSGFIGSLGLDGSDKRRDWQLLISGQGWGQ